MKILEITPYLDPKLGGQEKHVLALSETLSRLGHDVTILTCGTYPSGIVHGFDVSNINSVNLLGLRIISVKKLTRFLKENRFEVCHLHHQTIFGETILMINKIRKLPTVTTLHSLMLRRMPAKFLYDRISLRFMSALSSKVICLSPNIMQDLVGRGLKRSKCVVVPNGVDIRSLKSQFREMGKSLSGPEFDLLFVGRLEKRKGILSLLKSFILLHRNGKKYTLKIVGHGPLAQELGKMITANNLTRHVKLVGYISQQELLRCYLLAKVVLIPSLYEGVPTVALEAMAAGKPLVVSNIPGLNELVFNGSNGLIVNPMDTQGLASAIDRIMTAPNNLNSLNNINEKVLGRFDWKAVAHKLLETYNEALVDSRAN